MKHLSSSEFVDYVEGALDRERAAHVDACAACQRETQALRQTLHETSIVEVPEPSPLFWDHFSGRVREEIARTPVRAGGAWTYLRPLAAVAAAVLLVAIVVASRTPVRKPVERKQAAVDLSYAGKTLSSTPQDASGAAPESVEPDDEVWRLLKDAAGDLQMEEARAVGFGVRPGAVDRAVLDLSPRERAELGRLIEDEIRQTQRQPRRGMKELS